MVPSQTTTAYVNYKNIDILAIKLQQFQLLKSNKGVSPNNIGTENVHYCS